MILYFLIGHDIKPFLSFEMLFALIYIEAKREPEKLVTVWFVTTKSNIIRIKIFRCIFTMGLDAIFNDNWRGHSL